MFFKSLSLTWSSLGFEYNGCRDYEHWGIKKNPNKTFLML